MSHELLVANATKFDLATITSASPIAAAMGLGRLQTRQPGDACRFLDGSDAHVEIDLGIEVPVNLVAALSVIGADEDDTMRVRAATSLAGLTAAPGYDSGTSTIWPKSGLDDWPFVHAARYIDPSQPFRYWRIDWSFSGAHLDVGRLMVDSAYVSPRAVDIGLQLDTPSNTIAPRSEAGGVHIIKPGQMWRELEVSLNALTEAELLEGWLPLTRKVESSKDVFVWVDPGALSFLQERGLHGHVTDRAQRNAFYGNYYQARLRITEQLPNRGIGAE